MRPPQPREISRLIVRTTPELRGGTTYKPYKSLAIATYVKPCDPKYRTQLYMSCQRAPNQFALPLREVQDDRTAGLRFAPSDPNIRIKPHAKVKDPPILVHRFE